MTTLFLVLCLAATPARSATTLPWLSDWQTAFQTAKEQHRMVFVDYFATWCAPCQAMDKNVFSDAGVQQRLSDFVLLRIDFDRSKIAAKHGVDGLPTYVVYDPAERERFRIVGERSIALFSAAIDDIRGTTSAFLRAAELFDSGQDVEADFLAGNTFSHLGMTDRARASYAEARKAAEKKNDQPSQQLAQALSAFTFVRDGKSSRAIKLLRDLVAKTSDPNAQALIWLTLGNAYRSAKDDKAARESYQRAVAVAPPASDAFSEASAAMAQLH